MRDYFNPGWMEYSFGVLFGAMWQACVLVGMAAAVSSFLRRAAVLSALWTSCIIGLLVTPLLSLALPHCYIAYGGQSEPLHFPSLIARNSNSSFIDRFWTMSEHTWSSHACQILVVIWAVGAGVSTLRLAWSWFRVAVLLSMAFCCVSVRVQRIVRRVIPEASLVSVLQMHGLVGAVCWQIRRPKIILPAEIDRLSDSELEMIVRHEWAHLERSDPGGLFIQRIVEIVYWYHPLVWFATMQLGKYREFVCDDAVVHSGFSPADYALCLGQLAVWYYAPMPLAPAGLGLLWTQHLVLLRVRRLLDQPRLSHEMRRPQRMSLHLAAALVLMLCSIIRFDWQVKASTMSVVRWTAWPTWAAAALDTVGWQLRDFPLDAHRYDPHAALQHGTSTSEHAKAN